METLLIQPHVKTLAFQRLAGLAAVYCRALTLVWQCAPMIASVTATNDLITLQLDGQRGPDYVAQTSTNLVDWSILLITNSPVIPWRWSDTTGTNLTERFYRIKTGPPLP